MVPLLRGSDDYIANQIFSCTILQTGDLFPTRIWLIGFDWSNLTDRIWLIGLVLTPYSTPRILTLWRWDWFHSKAENWRSRSIPVGTVLLWELRKELCLCDFRETPLVTWCMILAWRLIETDYWHWLFSRPKRLHLNYITSSKRKVSRSFLERFITWPTPSTKSKQL